MPDWQLFRTETRGRKKLPIGKKQHLKIVHFTPESVVHYTPDCVVQYSPEYSKIIKFEKKHGNNHNKRKFQKQIEI